MRFRNRVCQVTDAATVRPRWPICEMQSATANPGGYWAPREIAWDPPQLFALPRIAREELHWSNLQYDRTRAIINLPDVLQNTPQRARKEKMAQQKGKSKEKGSCAAPDEVGVKRKNGEHR